MTIDLTRDEIWFLKALRAAGEHVAPLARQLLVPGSLAWCQHLLKEHRL